MKIWRKIKSSPNLYRRKKFDQIWPSLALTYRQRKKFMSKERYFTRALKKSISLRKKWIALQSFFRSHSFTNVTPESLNLIKSFQKPSRFMIYNKNFQLSNQEQKAFLSNDMVSLKNVFLAPGVLRIRKIKWSYALKMKSMNRVRLLLGNIPLKKLLSIFENSQYQSNTHKIWKFLGSLECLLSVALLKMGMSFHILQSIHSIKTYKILKNGEYKNGVLSPGSIIEYGLTNNIQQSHNKNMIFRSSKGALSPLSAQSSLLGIPYNGLALVSPFKRIFGEEFSDFYRIMWNMISHRNSIFKTYSLQKKRSRFYPIQKRKKSSFSYSKKIKIISYNPPFGLQSRLNTFQNKKTPYFNLNKLV